LGHRAIHGFGKFKEKLFFKLILFRGRLFLGITHNSPF